MALGDAIVGRRANVHKNTAGLVEDERLERMGGRVDHGSIGERDTTARQALKNVLDGGRGRFCERIETKDSVGCARVDATIDADRKAVRKIELCQQHLDTFACRRLRIEQEQATY